MFGYACHNTTLGETGIGFTEITPDMPRAIWMREFGSVALYMAERGGDADRDPRGRVRHVIDHGEAAEKPCMPG